MKHESNESDIIVYDLPEDYSVSTSSPSTRPTSNSAGEKQVSVPDQEYGKTGPKTLLGGVTGKVYDKLTYRRVEGASVTIVKNLSVKTDERGEFFITNIKPGTYRVTVSEDGYIVQSRKGTVVAGETTKLESFHLIPSCLAGDYPNEAVGEEEEIIEEEAIEVITETSSLISVEEVSCAQEAVDDKLKEEETRKITLEESPEKRSMASSDIITVEDTDSKIVTDSNLHAIITKEELIECPEAIVGKQILSTFEETVEEETAKNTIIASAPMIEQTLPDESISISAEEIKASEIAKASIETIMPLPEEKDSTEITIPVSEEIAVRGVADVVSQTPDESGMIKTEQSEKIQQELPQTETQSSLPWMAWFRRKLKRKSAVIDSPKPSVETAPEVANKEMIKEELPEKEPFAGANLSTEIISSADEEIQTPAMAVDFIEPVISFPEENDLPKAVIPVPERMVIRDISSVERLPHMFTETISGEMLQLIDFPREFPVKGLLFDAFVTDIAQYKTGNRLYQKEPLELSIEPITGFVVQELAIDSADDDGLFAGISTDDIVSIFTEDIPLPVIAKDFVETPISLPEEKHSTKTTMSTSEGTAVEEVSPADMIFQLTDETGIVEMAPLEEVERVFSKNEDQSILPWKRWVKNKNRIKRTFSKQDLLMPSREDVMEAIARNSVTEKTHQEEPPEPSIEVSQKISIHDEVLKKTHQKEPSIDVSVEEIADYRTMHETITGLNKQKETANVTVNIEEKEETDIIIIEEKPIDISDNYVFADGSPVPRIQLEGMSDSQIASISEEERAAMSPDHDSIEVAGFIGITNAQPNPTYKGLPISVAYTLKNVACDDPNDFVMQIIVMSSDTDKIYETFETPVNCRKGTFSMGGFVIFTTSYETCIYRLNMQIISRKTKQSYLLTSIPLEIKSISFNT